MIGGVIAPYGPDPELVARNARHAIYQEWRRRPELKDATIRNLALDRQGGRVYAGVVDAVVDGQLERYSLEVVVHGESFSWTLNPLPE